MIKLVAFDWNGTLLADTKPSFQTTNLILRSFGQKEISLHRYQQTFDIPILDFYEANGISRKLFLKHAEVIQEMYMDNYEPLADKCRTRSGVKATLRLLKKRKILSVIFSNHKTEYIKKHLRRLKIDRHLYQILARDHADNSHLHERNKEYKLCHFIKEHKIKPAEVMVVGDTCEEIEIGKKHGFKTVGITAGYCSVVRLKAQKPDYLVHNLKELVKIIKKLNSLYNLSI